MGKTIGDSTIVKLDSLEELHKRAQELQETIGKLKEKIKECEQASRKTDEAQLGKLHTLKAKIAQHERELKLSEAEDAERKDFEAHFQKEKELYNALIVRENSFQTRLKKEAAQIDAQLLLFEKYFGISLDIDPLTSEKTFTFT
ncbi:hypothetical protein ADUPG1_001017, partial [Aduncisulcus paluster]